MESGSSLPFGRFVGTRLDPSVLVTLVSVANSGQHLPVESTDAGGVFLDRFDTNLFWWLPDYQLAPAPDAAFAFAASAQGISDSSGLPLFTAQITLGLVAGEPAGLADARAAHPDATFQVITPASLDAALTIIGKTDTGQDDPRSYAAVLAQTSDLAYTATITLTGPAVTVAYDSLAHGTTATLAVNVSYSVWREWRPWRRPPIILEPPPIFVHPTAEAERADKEALFPITKVIPDGSILHRRFPPILIDPGGGGVEPPEPEPTWVTATDQANITIPIGNAYAADAYRPRFTVATGTGADATVRPIIDAADLTGFATARSEFIELTSLGAPADRYPSIRRLYFGLVSGRVVIIPQAYRIQRGSAGLSATLHAVVDDSPGPQVSGARFEFTFTLAPAIDPIDFAQLAHDLMTIPEAGGRPVSLVLADGLDPRFPTEFTGFSASTSSVADGDQPASLNVRVTIDDADQTPALDLVNLFLHQLGSTVAPMAGNVAVRLDDVYPTPVTTAIVVGLANTAGGDELSLTASGTTTVDAQNVGPVPLHLTGAASIAADGPHLVTLDAPLAANAVMPIEVMDSTLPIAVRGEVDLAAAMAAGNVLDLIDVQVETTQTIRHVLNFNAAGAFTGTVTQLDLIASLLAAPEVAITPLTLTATHPVDGVAFTLPLATALADLACQVTVTITDGGTTRSLVIMHDFASEPVMVITTVQIAVATP